MRAGLIDPVLVARARLRRWRKRPGWTSRASPSKTCRTATQPPRAPWSWCWRGEVQALMKGSLHTDELMAAVVWPRGGLRTKRRVSHCFVMQTPAYPRPFIITDAAINIAPTLEHKADIVRNAIDLAHAIGVAEPAVAILAAVETVNPACPPRWMRPRCARWPTAARSPAACSTGRWPSTTPCLARRRAHQGHRLRGGGAGRHPGRARPGERQHAGQAARIPGRCGQRRHRAGRARAHRAHQPRRLARDPHRLVRRGVLLAHHYKGTADHERPDPGAQLRLVEHQVRAV
jgi:hypothetical protein